MSQGVQCVTVRIVCVTKASCMVCTNQNVHPLMLKKEKIPSFSNNPTKKSHPHEKSKSMDSKFSVFSVNEAFPANNAKEMPNHETPDYRYITCVFSFIVYMLKPQTHTFSFFFSNILSLHLYIGHVIKHTSIST